jgi:hypothetical protein
MGLGQVSMHTHMGCVDCILSYCSGIIEKMAYNDTSELIMYAEGVGSAPNPSSHMTNKLLYGTCRPPLPVCSRPLLFCCPRCCCNFLDLLYQHIHPLYPSLCSAIKYDLAHSSQGSAPHRDCATSPLIYISLLRNSCFLTFSSIKACLTLPFFALQWWSLFLMCLLSVEQENVCDEPERGCVYIQLHAGAQQTWA